MSSAREIRSKIKSVQNIQKITLAMQMVSASKMRKAQDRMFASRPYANKILDVISNLKEADPQYYHPYMVIRGIKRIGMIIITSDRGLCSALNINVLKLAVAELKQWSLKNVKEDLCLIGDKAEAFFKRYGGNIVSKANHLGDSSGINDLTNSVKIMLDSYKEQRIDGLYIYFNEFVNTMVQKPRVQQLLPIMSYEIKKPRHRWDYIYEPNSYVLLDRLLDRYIESQIYQSAVENIACEYAARMVAMKSATDNAKNLIDNFKLKYNKARQATITNEISEIVSGADAI